MVMEEITAKVGGLRGDVESAGVGVVNLGPANVNVNNMVEVVGSAGGDGTTVLGGNINNNGPIAPQGPASNFYVIGLEFVRQYYTVLHQGPLYLHRFYSDDSCFVHDDSKSVYGQGNIRERIQQLNFRNCVAKILQVDSQETIGDGVVIQVRGELSNNGQPLRRFMQTFVLAPQTPKRFYVRNDIFHYQDEGLPLEALKESSPVESMTHEETEEKSDEDIDIPEDLSSLRNTTNSSEEIPGERAPEVVLNLARPPVDIIPPVRRNASPPVAEVSLLDGKIDMGQQHVKTEVEPRKTSHGFLVSSEEESHSGAGRSAPPPKEPPQEQGPPPPGVPPAAKTYANLFKSAPSVPQPQPQQQQFPAQINRNPFPPPPAKEPMHSPTADGNDGGNVRSPPTGSPLPNSYESGSSGRGLPPRGQYGGMGYRGGSTYRGGGGQDRRDNNRERLTSRSSTLNDDTGSMDGDGRRPINTYPDTQQLFVGNLPHTVTAGEIKEIFAIYGKVAEVKILRPNQKKAGTAVPYFSFVVFEEVAAAEAAIREKSKITMKMSDGTNRRLNVEEKHARGDDGRSFVGGGSMGYFPRNDNHNASTLPASGGNPSGGNGNNAGVGNKPYGPRGGGNPPRTGGGGEGERGAGSGERGGRGGMGGGSDHRGGDRGGHPIRTHSRTFRGSNRGGGGERGGGVSGGGGGGSTGAR